MLKLTEPNYLPCNSPLQYKRRIGLTIPRVVNVNGVACVGRQLPQGPLTAPNALGETRCRRATAQRQGTVVCMAYHQWVGGRDISWGWGDVCCKDSMRRGQCQKEISSVVVQAEPCLLGLTSSHGNLSFVLSPSFPCLIYDHWHYHGLCHHLSPRYCDSLLNSTFSQSILYTKPQWCL